jgi:hypothetical protein
MFLRSHRRIKDGKEHRYFSIEESRRLQSGRVVQRRVLYLGEINDTQQAAWRKTLEVFDEQRQDYTTLSLFPEDRPVPAEAVDSVQVKLSEMKLRRARPYGQLLAGMRAVAAVGAGSILGTQAGARTRRSELGAGAGVAGGQSAHRAGQRVSLASAMFRRERHGVLLAWISRWRRRIVCTGAWIGFWHTSAICSCICKSAGRISLTPPSTCCCTI